MQKWTFCRITRLLFWSCVWSCLFCLSRIYEQKNGLDLWQFPEYCKSLAQSLSIAERYWQTKALSKSNTKKSVPWLKRLIQDDTAINVKSSAIKALAKRSCDIESKTLFKDLMQTSPKWYIQIAAFTAYRQCQ